MRPRAARLSTPVPARLAASASRGASPAHVEDAQEHGIHLEFKFLPHRFRQLGDVRVAPAPDFAVYETDVRDQSAVGRRSELAAVDRPALVFDDVHQRLSDHHTPDRSSWIGRLQNHVFFQQCAMPQFRDRYPAAVVAADPRCAARIITRRCVFHFVPPVEKSLPTSNNWMSSGGENSEAVHPENYFATRISPRLPGCASTASSDS